MQWERFENVMPCRKAMLSIMNQSMKTLWSNRMYVTQGLEVQLDRCDVETIEREREEKR